MLDLFGRGYVIDHCVSLLRKKREEEAYKAYITDVLRLIANVQYKRAGGTEEAVPTRFYDVIHPKKESTQTADEIIYSFQKRLGKNK